MPTAASARENGPPREGRPHYDAPAHAMALRAFELNRVIGAAAGGGLEAARLPGGRS